MSNSKNPIVCGIKEITGKTLKVFCIEKQLNLMCTRNYVNGMIANFDEFENELRKIGLSEEVIATAKQLRKIRKDNANSFVKNAKKYYRNYQNQKELDYVKYSQI